MSVNLNKRPFSADAPLSFASKHLRHLDNDGPIASRVNDVAEKPRASDVQMKDAAKQSQDKQSPDGISNIQLSSVPKEKLNNRNASVPDDPYGSGLGNATPDEPSETGSAANKSEEDVSVEPHCSLSFYDENQIVWLDEWEEIFPHRRTVPIGQDHQADLPVWEPKSVKNSVGKSDVLVEATPHTLVTCAASTTYQSGKDIGDERLGICIMPMPDFCLATLEDVGAGCCKTVCNCVDSGSIRCARQHVTEARENLRRTLGNHRFEELGFSDMGEEVSCGWSEEEEQTFHEVIYSSPPTLGKSFWKHLSLVFPSRSNKELVSYYFNVFMLRKRARQNMSGPLYVDSDNDEWQVSDNIEFATSDEDEEDSALESPTAHDNVSSDSYHRDEADINEEDDADVCDDFVLDGEDDQGPKDFSKGWVCVQSGRVPCRHSVDASLQNVLKEAGSQDDSCLSSKTQHNWSYTNTDLDRNVPNQGGLPGEGNQMDSQYEYKNEGLSGFGFMDTKLWDTSYSCCREQRINFSPTSNVIEEVFGKGNWDNEATDSLGIR